MTNEIAIVESKLAAKLASTLTQSGQTALSLRREARDLEQRTFLALDRSGSMAEQCESGRKIDALRREVTRLRETGARFRQVVFDWTIEEVDEIGEPRGGTDLAGALSYCEAHGAKRIIVVSDGYPDDAVRALSAAESLARSGCRIDVFYVGPVPSGGQEFLRKLATVTPDGQYLDVDLGQQKALAGAVAARLALPPKRG
jgi:hypothetical protein